MPLSLRNPAEKKIWLVHVDHVCKNHKRVGICCLKLKLDMRVLTAQIALSDFSANQNHEGSMRVEFSHLPTGLPIQAIDWVFLHQLETVATTFAGTTPRPSLRSTAPDVPLAGITSPNSMAQCSLPRLMPATSCQDQASEFLSLET
jgi:hypothetical protein